MKEYLTFRATDISSAYGGGDSSEQYSRTQSRTYHSPSIPSQGRLQMFVEEHGWSVIASVIHCDIKSGYPTYHFILEREIRE